MTDPQPTPTSEESVILLGAIAVEAALFAQRRVVSAVRVDEELDYRKVEPLRRLCKAQGVTFAKASRETLDALAGEAGGHGGVLAEVGPRQFEALEAIKGKFVVMLDGVEDPFNFGQSVRALWAAGCDGLVVRERNWLTAAAVVTRASAGATELMPTAMVDTPETAAEHFRNRPKPYVIAATAAQRGAVNLFEVNWRPPTFLLIGGEKRGIKRAFLDQADMVMQVPYGRDYDPSLGTVAATSAIAFSRLRSLAEG